MKFKNRANEEVKLVDGRTVWLSRSPAVVGVIFIVVKDEMFILTEQRSSIMDEPNKWAVVSGYLDWNENGYEGIIRETFEETSFYIPDHSSEILFDNDKQPFYVHTDPWTDAKQNVSLSYIFIYKMDKLPKQVEQFKDSEIQDVKLMKLDEINDGRIWAFDHDKRIQMAIDKFHQYLPGYQQLSEK